MKINDKSYWDDRFQSGNWEEVGGRDQTRSFAEKQVSFFELSSNFSGTMLDFGCGLGDAIPVYRRRYPDATIIGMDFSSEAITQCRQKFCGLAEFRVGDQIDVASVDVIVASNVIEHLPNDIDVVRQLFEKCRELYVIVPYMEIHRIPEHLHTYSRRSFSEVGPCRSKVFDVQGWSQYGLRSLWFEIYMKNLLRPIFGRRTVKRRLQIMFHFSQSLGKH